MAIDLRLTGGSGQFKVDGSTNAITQNLSNVSPITITPPAGKTLRLDALMSGGGVNAKVTIGTTDIINGTLTNPGDTSAPAGSYSISNVGGGGGGGIVATSGCKQPLTAFQPDQSITISSTSVTLANVSYSYSWGE